MTIEGPKPSIDYDPNKEQPKPLDMTPEEELRERGYEDVEELLKNLEIGLQQCRDGKGMTTEELKEKLKKVNAKYKKTLTNLAKDKLYTNPEEDDLLL